GQASAPRERRAVLLRKWLNASLFSCGDSRLIFAPRVLGPITVCRRDERQPKTEEHRKQRERVAPSADPASETHTGTDQIAMPVHRPSGERSVACGSPS